MLKIGGELLEDGARMKAVARLIARVAAEAQPLVVVHGGGKEIDAALAQAAIPKHQVDGLRITDEATLQVVIAVLAGSINTRLVAAINAAGGQAVGLTGADAGVGPVKAARAASCDQRRAGGSRPRRRAAAGAGAPLLDTLCADRLRAGHRLHRRIARRTAVQRQRRHARRQPGRAAVGAARWSSPAPPRACWTAKARRLPRSTRAAVESLVELGHGDSRHGGETARLPTRARQRRRATS